MTELKVCHNPECRLYQRKRAGERCQVCAMPTHDYPRPCQARHGDLTCQREAGHRGPHHEMVPHRWGANCRRNDRSVEGFEHHSIEAHRAGVRIGPEGSAVYWAVVPGGQFSAYPGRAGLSPEELEERRESLLDEVFDRFPHLPGERHCDPGGWFAHPPSVIRKGSRVLVEVNTGLDI